MGRRFYPDFIGTQTHVFELVESGLIRARVDVLIMTYFQTHPAIKNEFVILITNVTGNIPNRVQPEFDIGIFIPGRGGGLPSGFKTSHGIGSTKGIGSHGPSFKTELALFTWQIGGQVLSEQFTATPALL